MGRQAAAGVAMRLSLPPPSAVRQCPPASGRSSLRHKPLHEHQANNFFSSAVRAAHRLRSGSPGGRRRRRRRQIVSAPYSSCPAAQTEDRLARRNARAAAAVAQPAGDASEEDEAEVSRYSRERGQILQVGLLTLGTNSSAAHFVACCTFEAAAVGFLTNEIQPSFAQHRTRPLLRTGARRGRAP